MLNFGQGGLEHITGAAQLHLLLPGSVDGSIANGAVDEPAQVTGGKLPGRALLAPFLGTEARVPAWLDAVAAAQFAGEQKIELALDMDGSSAPRGMSMLVWVFSSFLRHALNSLSVMAFRL